MSENIRMKRKWVNSLNFIEGKFYQSFHLMEREKDKYHSKVGGWKQSYRKLKYTVTPIQVIIIDSRIVKIGVE